MSDASALTAPGSGQTEIYSVSFLTVIASLLAYIVGIIVGGFMILIGLATNADSGGEWRVEATLIGIGGCCFLGGGCGFLTFPCLVTQKLKLTADGFETSDCSGANSTHSWSDVDAIDVAIRVKDGGVTGSDRQARPDEEKDVSTKMAITLKSSKIIDLGPFKRNGMSKAQFVAHLMHAKNAAEQQGLALNPIAAGATYAPPIMVAPRVRVAQLPTSATHMAPVVVQAAVAPAAGGGGSFCGNCGARGAAGMTFCQGCGSRM